MLQSIFIGDGIEVYSSLAERYSLLSNTKATATT